MFTGKSRKKGRAVFSEAGLAGDAHEPLAPCAKVCLHPTVFPFSSKLTVSWPDSFRSPQEDEQVLWEQIAPQRKESRLPQGPWEPAPPAS